MKELQVLQGYHNLGWLFYRNMFNDKLRIGNNRINVDFSFLNEATEEGRRAGDEQKSNANQNKLDRLNKDLTEFKYKVVSWPANNYTLEKLNTTYPGLLIGSGYTHETGLTGEMKLGFFFDHTSGLPVIPGSSIKGAIRSAFPNHGNSKIADKEAKTYFVWSVLSTMNEKMFPSKEWDEINWTKDSPESRFVNKLEQVIFDGRNPEWLDLTTEKRENRSKVGSPVTEFVSIYKRDIFHDAVITKAGKDDKILGNDYITPHINRNNPELSPFTSPTPLQFLKVLPNVEFSFTFKPMPSTIEGKTIDINTKQKLFLKIIEHLGLGAKTNVGYGQFSSSRNSINSSNETSSYTTIITEGDPQNYAGRIAHGLTLEAKVKADNKLIVILNNERIDINCARMAFPIGTLVVAEMADVSGGKIKVLRVKTIVKR